MTGIATNSGPESNERQSIVKELERLSQEIVQRLPPEERRPSQDSWINTKKSKVKFREMSKHEEQDASEDFFECINLTFYMEDKLKVCPCQLEDQIKSATSGSPKNITTSGKDTLTVQTRNKKQSEYLLELKKRSKPLLWSVPTQILQLFKSNHTYQWLRPTAFCRDQGRINGRGQYRRSAPFISLHHLLEIEIIKAKHC